MVSIILPCYNREKAVLKAINSVIAQTFFDWELIVVDDCSTDGSVDAINGFHDKRIKVIRTDKNSGPAAARNLGIKASRGEYISLLDSDDFYEPEFLEESIKVLENTSPEVGFMWTGARFLTNNSSWESTWEPGKKGTPYLSFLHSLQIGTNTGITFKSEVFYKSGYFNEKLPAAEDTEFFLRITKDFSFTRTHKILINIRRSDSDRLSKNFKKIAIAYNIFLPEHFDEINNDNFLRRKFFYKMMWLNFNLSDKKSARDYYSKIPKKDFSSNAKYFLVYLLYEIFPVNFASKMHRSFSSPD